MATISGSTIVKANLEKVWELVGNFNALPEWFPFIIASELREGDMPDRVGAVRTLQARGGGVVRERLLELSDSAMRLRFLTFEGADLTPNYNGHMQGALLVARSGVTVRPLNESSLKLKTCLVCRADDDSKIASEFVRAYMRKGPDKKHKQLSLPISA
jgi:hypothetical protein